MCCRLFRRLRGSGWGVLFTLFVSTGASAHEGHEHAPLLTKTSATDTGQLSLRSARLADGSLFVPKPAQFRLGITSTAVQPIQHASSLTLKGMIIADPNHSAQVASPETGILEAAATGFPVVGARVVKGQTLALVKPVIEENDRIRRHIAGARNDLDMQINDLAQVQSGTQYKGQTPMASTKLYLEGLMTERRAMEIRKREIERSLRGRNAVKAPLAGEISLANAQIGGLARAGQTLFEIIDPAHLWVEAQTYAVLPAEAVGDAVAYTRSGEAIPLAFVGQGLASRGQSLPLDFRITRVSARPYIGQPVTVYVRTRSPEAGIVLPQSSLTRTADGRARVWVQTAAERYVARTVQTRVLADNHVLVLTGLQVGERVVSQGAWLLEQIR